MSTEVDSAVTWLHSAGGVARAASGVLARAPAADRDAALRAAAGHIRAGAAAILAANAADLAASQAAPAFRDRLTLTPERVEAMAAGLEEIAAVARSARPHLGRMDAAERPAVPAASPRRSA